MTEHTTDAAGDRSQGRGPDGPDEATAAPEGTATQAPADPPAGAADADVTADAAALDQPGPVSPDADAAEPAAVGGAEPAGPADAAGSGDADAAGSGDADAASHGADAAPLVADDVAADVLVPDAPTVQAATSAVSTGDPQAGDGGTDDVSTDHAALDQPGAVSPDAADAGAPADAADVGAPAEAPASDAPDAGAPAAEGTAADAPAAEGTVADAPAAHGDAAGGASAPSPTAARPTPRPTPRPVPRPAPRAPQAPTASAGAPVAPVAPPQDAAEALHAATFGRVDEEGTVYVREAAGERAVGQFPGATAEEALALYVRRYLDLHAKVVLFEARLASADLPAKEVDQTLSKLSEELTEPAAVGDLDGLRTRLDGLRAVAAERRAAADAERAAAREAAVASRTSIVEQAEKIAGTDPERIQWRPAGEQLRQLLDQWKDAQRNGPRIDRPTEESLWKRFSHARTTFDRERRHFFAELESRNASARAAKEALVAQAEKLATSTDWGATAGAYRDLMAQWKASGRASRKDDDALWARFRAAQDRFFAARDAASAETDAEFRANLTVKEGLLREAEALLPIRDLASAKSALRSIQDRWDAAGKVPRGDLQRVEARLRAVENAVRDADQSAWTRGNPETRARAEGAAAQLESAIAGLEADLRAAEAAGDARRIADARAALDARRAWLEQVRRAAQGS